MAAISSFEGRGQSFLIDVNCHFNTYEIKHPKHAGLLFADVIATSQIEADRLARDEDHLLTAGQRSPWVQTYASRKKHAFATATLIPVAQRRRGAVSKDNLDALEIAYQASTRPDEKFIVHQGIEVPGMEHAVSILLPSATGQEALRGVRGFSQWADDRLDLVKRLGAKEGEGPRKIQVLAMNDGARTPHDIDKFIEAARGPLPDPRNPPDKDAAPQRIQIAAGECLEAVAFDGSLFHPAWKLSTARALATFADGGPALVLNQFGKGRAILLGGSALMLSNIAVQSQSNPDFDKVRQAALFASDLAGVTRPCRASVSRINAYVRDGPQQTVVVLINSTDSSQKAVGIHLESAPHNT